MPNSPYRGWYTWQGKQNDSEIGLLNSRAREYDPFTGRFISEDPSGFDAGDSNLYRYVKNEPTILTDPSGEKPQLYDPAA